MTEMTGRRTRIRPGREEDYRRVHELIPTPVVQALQASGVIRWHIWIDGSDLFHAIETEHGYEAMMARVASLGAVDPDWDLLIATLPESEPTAEDTLPLVWSMGPRGQIRRHT